jgi:hypothetical protein
MTERNERPDPSPPAPRASRALLGDPGRTEASLAAVARARDELGEIQKLLGSFTVEDVRNSGGE